MMLALLRELSRLPEPLADLRGIVPTHAPGIGSPRIRTPMRPQVSIPAPECGEGDARRGRELPRCAPRRALRARMPLQRIVVADRSEERRVGKEGRPRGVW